MICSKVILDLSWYRHLCVKNIHGTSSMIFFCYARQIGMSYKDRRLILSSKLEESLRCSFPLGLSFCHGTVQKPLNLVGKFMWSSVYF